MASNSMSVIMEDLHVPQSLAVDVRGVEHALGHPDEALAVEVRPFPFRMIQNRSVLPRPSHRAAPFQRSPHARRRKGFHGTGASSRRAGAGCNTRRDTRRRSSRGMGCVDHRLEGVLQPPGLVKGRPSIRPVVSGVRVGIISRGGTSAKSGASGKGGSGNAERSELGGAT